MRTYQNCERQNRGRWRGNYNNENYNRKRGGSRSRKDHFQEILIKEGMTEGQVTVDQDQDQE